MACCFSCVCLFTSLSLFSSLHVSLYTVSMSTSPSSPSRLRGRAIHAIFFDLDGTLAETDEQTVASLLHRFNAISRWLPAASTPRLARTAANWITDRFNDLLAVLDAWRVDISFQRWLRRRGALQIADANASLTPVRGVNAMIEALAPRYPLAIISTRTVAEVAAYLAQHGLASSIALVIGSDNVERLKPHPLPLLTAAQLLGIDPAHALMVGDTKVDVQAAKAAGALAVGVLCGFGDRRDLRQADLILASTADLAAWL